MNIGFDMSLRLQQKLSFQMIQSLKLLQVNTMQLEQILKTELELNPVLEEAAEAENEAGDTEEKTEEREKPDDDRELEVSEDKVDWEEYIEEGFGMGNTVNEETDPNQERYEPEMVHQKTLDEHLEGRLAEKNVTEAQRLLANFIIGSLDADGYLRMPLKEIADFTGMDVMAVEEALQIVWTLDQPGIGARNLQECLLLQLKARGMENTLAMRIITEAWELFERWKIHDIAGKFGIDIREVQQTVDYIKTLNPTPGTLVAADKTTVIIPDLIVEKVDGEFVVMLNDRSVPMLHINKAYAQMLSRGSTVRNEVKSYVREKLNSAAWLVRAIEQRRTTMLKVMYAIIERQREFFEMGPPHLGPLNLRDVAEMIGMHISTISRVTSNKYVQTPFGIFEGKYFFPVSMVQGGNDGDISSQTIKNRIQELIENENSGKPLSDQKIMNLLSGENFTVARRTVAKYREQMKILSARLRQTYN